MPKKNAKRDDRTSAEVRRSSGRADPDREPLMLAVERCPPREALVFEWVVGQGLGDDAVVAAQRAFERAYEVRLGRARERANAPDEGTCPPGCETGTRTVLGPLSGTQKWEIDSGVAPMRAATWNWVGFLVVTDCKPI